MPRKKWQGTIGAVWGHSVKRDGRPGWSASLPQGLSGDIMYKIYYYSTWCVTLKLIMDGMRNTIGSANGFFGHILVRVWAIKIHGLSEANQKGTFQPNWKGVRAYVIFMHVLSKHSRWFCPYDSHSTWEIAHISSEIDCYVIIVTQCKFGIFLSQSQICSYLRHNISLNHLDKGQFQLTQFSGKLVINNLWLKLNGIHLDNYIFKFISLTEVVAFLLWIPLRLF